MTLRDSVLTGIPEGQKDLIERQFVRQGATVTSEKMPDGTWTIRATFADAQSGGEAVPAAPASSAASVSPVPAKPGVPDPAPSIATRPLTPPAQPRTAAAPAAPTAPQVPPAHHATPVPDLPLEDWLGKLSERFETGGRGPRTVSTGVGDAGGVSYGSYQMTSRGGGTVARFVAQEDFPWRSEFIGLTPGTAPFTQKWVDIATAEPRAFHRAEHQFIKRTHFDPLVARVRAEHQIDIASHSRALQNVIWSTAVQHGPNSTVVQSAINALRERGAFDPDAAGFDRSLIEAIYAERGRQREDGALVHFSNNSREVQAGVAKRFVNELRDALKLLEDEA